MLEGHTYYKYICDNYDNLSDFTIFLQGYPFDHSPNLFKNIANHTSEEFKFLSERIIRCNLNGCVYHPSLPLKEVYEKVFGVKKDILSFKFGAGAQFIVSKEKIRKRPKEFYSNIVNILGKDISPIEGYVIERFHNLIFN
jgi:hypothetical protein